MLKLALISDIHFAQNDSGAVLGSQGKELFLDLLPELATFDLLIDLGDRITASSSEIDYKNNEDVNSWFNKLSIRHEHIIGNHDLKYLSKEKLSEIYNYTFENSSFDYAGFHIVLVNSLYIEKSKVFFEESFLSWLENDLKNTNLPCIIFSHCGLIPQILVRNHNFYWQPHKQATYLEELAVKAREIIENSEKVILCINGHSHWNTYSCSDGIHYITIPSLTDSFATYPSPASSWAILEIDHCINLKVKGNLPIEYNLPIKDLKHHWLTKQCL